MEWAAAWQSCMERGRRCGCWRRCWRRGAERALSLNGRALLVRWEPLGEGAFSSVYACCDASTGEPFAIKEMLCQSAEQLSAARAEVRIHRKVGRHPGLLPLIDACELEAGPRGAIIVALLMPLFTRGTLFDLLQRQAATSNAASVGLGGRSGSGGGGGSGGPMAENSALRLFRSVCSAIHKLHAAGIAHRDLKPHNVLLSDHGDPCVMDFGSSCEIPIHVTSRKQAVMLQDQAAQLCSLPYRAPELFDVGSKTTIDEKVDVWSLGCLLFAITYGRGFSPFECQWRGLLLEPCTVSMSAVINPIRMPPEVRMSYSDDFFALMEWALTVEPRNRPGLPQLIDRIDEKWPELLYNNINTHNDDAGRNKSRRAEVV
jgi:serine/threonine kinase 16